MPEDQALVLGGGGVAGIAWMTGALAGLADAGQDVTGADLLVGTSAGAAVAAQVSSGLPLDALVAASCEVPGVWPFPQPVPLQEVVERLRSGGSQVTAIAPDEASVTAMGINPLDPATRVPAAQAGRAQGRAGARLG